MPVHCSPRFEAFIRRYKCTADAQPTHVRMPPWCAKYAIPEQDMPSFWEEYRMAVQSGVNTGVQEAPVPVIPGYFDLDLRVASTTRTYSRAHVEELVALLFTHAAACLELGTAARRAYVFERPCLSPDASTPHHKDGVHILLHDIALTPAEWQTFRRARLLTDPKVARLLTEGMATRNSVDQCIDESTLGRNRLFITGSGKPDTGPYVLAAVYAYDPTSGALQPDPEPLPPPDQLAEALSIRAHREHTPAPDLRMRELAAPATHHSHPSYHQPAHTAADEADLARAEQLAAMLAPARADSYQSWIEVGLCLHNIDPGARMLAAWHAFSRQSAKYEPGACDEKWAGMAAPAQGRPALTMGSLVMWAQQDSPERFGQQLAARHTPPSSAALQPTLEQARLAVHHLLRCLGHDPSLLSGVRSASINDRNLTIDAELEDVGDVRLQLDMSSLRTTMTRPDRADPARALTVMEKFMHEQEAIRLSGGYDPASLHKDLHSGREWDVTRPETNRALFSARDKHARIELLNLDGPPAGWGAKVELLGPNRCARLTNKRDIRWLQKAYATAIADALTNTWGMGWAIQHNHVQIYMTNTIATTEDETTLSHQQIVDTLLQAEPLLRERLAFCTGQPGDGRFNGMYYCDPRTNVWNLVHNAFIERMLVAVTRQHAAALALSPKDMRYIESKGGRSDLRVVLSQEVQVPGFAERLDTSLDLMPFANGALDFSLPGIPFRAFVPQDLVSATTGWDYSPEQAREMRPAVTRFFEQVLLLPEERAAVLAFFAGLLTGDLCIKKFLALTDKRGGNTGKSAFADLLKAFFGKLAKSKGAKLVTRPAVSNSDRNSHDAGIQCFRAKRLVVAEELKKNMHLDEGMLKHVTSPRAVVEGRMFGSSSEFSFVWTAGVVLIFNEGDCPKADATDSAFWARAIVAPFRSKFLPASAMGGGGSDDEEEAEPYTYPMDPGLSRRFPSWLSAVADILRDAYSTLELLTDLPASMRDWKSELACSHNPVAEWLESVVEFTGNHADDRVVFSKEMWERTHGLYRNATLKLTSLSDFKSMLKAFFQQRGAWKNLMRVKGAVDPYRNVAMGVRLHLDQSGALDSV